MDTNSVLEYLNKFKDIPTYQLERRVDALILPYLELAVAAKLKDVGAEAFDLKPLYPEFPLRASSDCESRHSKHADYLLWSQTCNTVYFIELKTDVRSVDEDQFQNYVFNCRNGWQDLLHFYLGKAIKNPNWRKFVSGLICLKEGEGILGKTGDWELHQFLTVPNGINKRLVELKDSISFNSNPQVRFIYLAPKRSSLKLESFKREYDSESDFYLGLITLESLSKHCPSPFAGFLQELDQRN